MFAQIFRWSAYTLLQLHVRSNVDTWGNSVRYTISDQRDCLGNDIIEAIECLKSRFREEISCGDSKDVASPEIWADVGREADRSGGATVVNGGGWVVSRESCLFVCYHVCIIVSPCTVCRARLHGPTVF